MAELDPPDPWAKYKKRNRVTQTEASQHKEFCGAKQTKDPRPLVNIKAKKLKIHYDMSGSEHTHPDKLVLKAFRHYQKDYLQVMQVSGGEILGFIFQHGSSYYFTDIMNSTTGGFTGDPVFQNKKDGSTLIAYFHSHPVKGHGTYESFHFSRGDTKSAVCSKESGLHIGYLRTADGDIRRIDRSNYHIRVEPYNGNAAIPHFPGKTICPNKCPCLIPYPGFSAAKLKSLKYSVRVDIPKNKKVSDTIVRSVQNRFKRLCLNPAK